MSTGDPKQTNGMILVVDDTIANLRLLIALLETAGYCANGAVDGKTALMICTNKPPELILLDIRMPQMDGFEVCRQLKLNEKTRNIPVIFISALDDADDKVRGFEVGAVDYITKPFRSNEVLARVSTHISLFRMHQEIEQVNIKLRTLDQLKSLFIASMSHELRTPLNSIIGFSSILLQGISGELNPQQKDDVERINRSGKHLLELISDVIDISKIEAGRVEVSPQQVSLQELVQEAVDNIRPMAQEKAMTIKIHADAFPQIVTDRKYLLQCLLNVLSNAVKYSEQGEVLIHIHNENTHIKIAVEDNGIGISEENITRVFDAFERIENHMKLKAGGTGLGLYLTKKIVTELLQGKIEVKSQENVGSTFSLCIPRTLVPPTSWY
jgi:signal transduction histidine kinase